MPLRNPKTGKWYVPEDTMIRQNREMKEAFEKLKDNKEALGRLKDNMVNWKDNMEKWKDNKKPIMGPTVGMIYAPLPLGEMKNLIDKIKKNLQ